MQKLQNTVSTQHGVANVDTSMQAHIHFGYRTSFNKPEGYLKKDFQTTDDINQTVDTRIIFEPPDLLSNLSQNT